MFNLKLHLALAASGTGAFFTAVSHGEALRAGSSVTRRSSTASVSSSNSTVEEIVAVPFKLKSRSASSRLKYSTVVVELLLVVSEMN
jgi:hypothetical protein